MNLKYESFELRLKDPFTISRSSIVSKKVVYVNIDEGIGEASPSYQPLRLRQSANL
jgi:hypothetical protein